MGGGGGEDKANRENGGDVDSCNSSQNYLSVVRLCFWDRKLQEIEQEEIKEV
jgi:hypothetical protein